MRFWSLAIHGQCLSLCKSSRPYAARWEVYLQFIKPIRIHNLNIKILADFQFINRLIWFAWRPKIFYVTRVVVSKLIENQNLVLYKNEEHIFRCPLYCFSINVMPSLKKNNEIQKKKRKKTNRTQQGTEYVITHEVDFHMTSVYQIFSLWDFKIRKERKYVCSIYIYIYIYVCVYAQLVNFVFSLWFLLSLSISLVSFSLYSLCFGKFRQDFFCGTKFWVGRLGGSHVFFLMFRYAGK